MFIPPQSSGRERKSARKHQKTAIQAAVHTLRHGGRATVVLPCGTGKTLIAGRVAEELAATGRARRRLVLLPTRDLLAQTVTAFQADSDHLGRIVAVCSPHPTLEALGIARTSSTAELAALLQGHDHYTVFATYAQLVAGEEVHGAIRTAHAQRLIPSWDLIICDEAHRTSGSLGKAWAAVHDDEKIPAARRLYLTATPRIWTTDPKYAENMPRDGDLYLAASMDDEDLYGPTVFSMQLSQAIAPDGLARDYRIVLVAVDHPTLQTQLRRTRHATHTDTVALISLATALLKTCATYDVSRMLTFHKAIADGDAFIDTLKATAQALDGETIEGPHGPVPLRPANLWAHNIHQNHPERFELLDTFRGDVILHEGLLASLIVLANSKLLGEGNDFPTVDGLCFASPKSSVTDVVQALGRAVRPHPHKTDKATLLVPIYLGPGEDPGDLLHADSHQPLYDILLALRAHDLRIADRLPTTDLSHPTDHPPVNAPGGPPPETPSEEPAEPTAELEPAASTPPFTAGSEPDFPEIVGTDGMVLTARDINRVMNLRVMHPQGATDGWMDMAIEVMRFHDEHGHIAITRAQAATLRTDPHRVDPYTWLASQRTARRRGELATWQISLLDSLGMQWEPREENRERFITYAEECAREHGGLAVSVGHEAPDGYKLGQRLRNERNRADPKTNGKADAELHAELRSLDPYWNPEWSFPWQRYYQQARHRHAQGLPLTQPGDGRAYRQWLRNPGTDLGIDQIQLLEAIGIQIHDNEPEETPT